MDERTPGLILRVRPLTETSLIVHWLTPALGRVATVAKGARRQTSPFRGKLDLFYTADFSFARSRRSSLHTLREVVLLETHPILRRELDALEQAGYAALLIEQLTETDTPLPEVFSLLLSLLHALAAAPPRLQTIFAFEARLLALLGLCPDPNQARVSPESRRILSAWLVPAVDIPADPVLPPGRQTEVSVFLHGLLAGHIGHPVKGRARLFESAARAGSNPGHLTSPV